MTSQPEAGPHILDASVDADLVEARLLSTVFSGRRLGALLLDQSFLAGVGNYVRSEALFVAGVHPDERPRDLDAPRRRALAEAVLWTARHSSENAGVTVPPDVAQAQREAGEPHRAWRHWVFGRADAACRRCGLEIQKRTSAGRRVYVCPGCQPEPAMATA